jgi:hypothetical protein
MAQDLLNTHPEAVLIDKNGYYQVRYGLLGIEMMTLEQWQNTASRVPSYSGIHDPVDLV